MPPRSLIIDTDPGQDDAVAILLALASPELEVLGITAVAGNVPLSYTTRNARIILELAGRTDIPVFSGAIRPMVRPLVTAEHVHGKTGLDGPELPEPTMPLQEEDAVDFIIRTLREHPAQSVTLCPVGPLTNIGLAFSRAPDIVSRVKEIVLMGGGYFEGGNITPAAEFNIYVDPHAAEIVFKSGAPIVMMPSMSPTRCYRRKPGSKRSGRWATAQARWFPTCSRSLNVSISRNTAPMAAPCTILAPLPIC